MSKLKIALIAGAMVAALSPIAHAFEARLGNGSTWVTINPSATGTVELGASQSTVPFSRYGNGHN
jgi:hypothetical protein